MDVKAYIESGILEQYALGEVSDQERRAVECLSKIYPEIKSALAEAEDDLESLAMIGAIKAPESLKARMLSDLAGVEQLPADSDEIKKESVPEDGEKVVPISKTSTWPVVWAAAASIAVLIAFWQYVTVENTQAELAEAKEEQEQLLADNEYLRGEVEYLGEDVEESFDPAFAKVVLDPTENIEADQLSVIWNRQSGEVKLNLADLPQLPSDRQYQLWILKDGVPSDMGVLPKDTDEIFLAGQTTLDGETFAITIEPLGGLPEPSLDQLVFIGNV